MIGLESLYLKFSGSFYFTSYFTLASLAVDDFLSIISSYFSVSYLITLVVLCCCCCGGCWDCVCENRADIGWETGCEIGCDIGWDTGWDIGWVWCIIGWDTGWSVEICNLCDEFSRLIVA